jgi:hypothetical protein
MLKKRRSNMVSQESDVFDQVLASSQGGLGNAELIQQLGLEQVSNSANEKLPYRSFLEQTFGENLSDVSVSLGGDEAVEALNLEQAKAAAFVNTIMFESQNPSLELVAHEVVHILQQRNSGQDGGEEEADAGARAALARRSFEVKGGAAKKPAFKKKKVSDVRAYNTNKQDKRAQKKWKSTGKRKEQRMLQGCCWAHIQEETRKSKSGPSLNRGILNEQMPLEAKTSASTKTKKESGKPLMSCIQRENNGTPINISPSLFSPKMNVPYRFDLISMIPEARKMMLLNTNAVKSEITKL